MRVDNALNCPLCDSDDVGVYSDMMGGLSVGCNDCGCEGPTRDTRDEAVAAWNKRPKLTLAAPDMLAACEGLVGSLPDYVLDLTGPIIGWSNVSTIKFHRDIARAAIAKAKREE